MSQPPTPKNSVRATRAAVSFAMGQAAAGVSA
jgi:hypothetical protein